MTANIHKPEIKASMLKTLGLIIGPLLFVYFFFFTNLDQEQPAVSATLAVALLMAIWWVTEAVPLAVTSLIPVALFPLLGIMDGKDVSSTYFKHLSNAPLWNAFTISTPVPPSY